MSTPTRGSEAKDGRSTKSGPVVRYGEGPTRRVEVPKNTLARPEVKAPTIGKGPAGKDEKSTGDGKAAGNSLAAGRPVKTKTLGDLKSNAPDKLDDVRVLTRGISRAHDLATGVAFGALGGVRPGAYYGGLPLDGNDCHDGYNDWYNPWYGNSWCWWGGAWWGSSCYFSWYYPWWYWCSRPYYASYYAYWPVTTVIYADDDPEVIYIERESAPVNEPVGEAVVGAPAQPGAAPSVPAADSPLSIAAQRYLELGDRAFREGRYADAVQFYAKAVEFAPDQGALYLVLADALFAAGDYHYGAYAVRRALELDAALVESNVDKHGFYPDPAQFDAQLAKLEQFLAEHPSDRDARLVLALNYLFGGRARDAVRTIDSAVGAMAEDAAAAKVLARAKTVAGS